MTPRERSEVLYLVQEEVRRLVGEGIIIDAEAVAGKFEVSVAEVERCLAAVQALGAASLPGTLAAARVAVPPPVHDASLPPLPEDYEILGELGRGGMAIVYRARQKTLDRVVAVKVLRPGEMLFDTMLKRFEKEARTLAKLRHPHIVSVHEVGQAGANVFFSMDLVEGASLHELIGQGTVTPSRAVKLMRQVASAVSYAHSRGLIHRDLKPANILVDREDNAFVADFGLAREISGTEGMTHTGQILGTPAFMAPEQARGDTAAIGEPADIYALGAILYECLTGKLPFAGKPLPDLVQAVLREDPPPPRRVNPKVPRDLEIVCLKAMEKDPARRYATAQAFLEDLERFEEGREIRARPPSVAYRMTKLAGRHRGSLVTSLVAAAVAGALLWTVVRPLIGATPATLLASADEALSLERLDAAEFLFTQGLTASGDPGNADASPVATKIHLGLATCLLKIAAREEAAGRIDAAAKACDRAGSVLSFLDERQAGRLREECDEFGALTEARRGNLPALLDRLRRPTWSTRDPDSHRQGILDRAAPALADPANPGHPAAVAALTAALAVGDARGTALWLGDRGEAGARLLPEIAAALAGLGPAEGAEAAAGLEEAVAGLALFHAAAMEEPLADVAADERVPASRRLLAARLLAVCADIPWWPAPDGSGTTQGPGDIARLWNSGHSRDNADGGTIRDEGFRSRVDLALSAAGTASVLRDRWLSARLGPAFAGHPGGAEAWWREHRGEDPRERLLSACGLERGATPADVLGRLSDAPSGERPLIHSLLLLMRPEGSPAPAWTLSRRRPEWTPSPPDLETAWHVALRGHLPETALQIRIAQLASVDGDPDVRVLWSDIVPVRIGDRIRFERSRPLPPAPVPPGIRLEFQVPEVDGPDWPLQGSGLSAGEFSANLRLDRRGDRVVLRWSRCRFGERGNSFGTDETGEGGLLLRLSQGMLADGKRMPTPGWRMPVSRYCEQWVLARLERVGAPATGDSAESWGGVLAGEIEQRADAAESAPGTGGARASAEVLGALYAAECAGFLPARGAVPALGRLDRALSGPAPPDRSPGPAARAAVFWARLRAGDAAALAGEEPSRNRLTVWPPGKHQFHWLHRWTALVDAGGDPGIRAFASAQLSREQRWFITAGMADRLRASFRREPVAGAGWMDDIPGEGTTGPLAWILAGGLAVAFGISLVLCVGPRVPLEDRLRPTALALSMAMLLPFLRIEIAGTALPVTLPAVLAAMILSWAVGAGLRGRDRPLRIAIPSYFALALLGLANGLRRQGGASPLLEVTWGAFAGLWFAGGIASICLSSKDVLRGTGPDGVRNPLFNPSWGRWAAFLARPRMSHETWLARDEKRRRQWGRTRIPWFSRFAARPLAECRDTWGDLLLGPVFAIGQFAFFLPTLLFVHEPLGSPWSAGARFLGAAMVGVPIAFLLFMADRRGSPPSFLSRLRALLPAPRPPS